MLSFWLEKYLCRFNFVFLIFNGNQRYKCISLGHELAYFAFVSMILLLDFDYSDSVVYFCI